MSTFSCPHFTWPDYLIMLILLFSLAVSFVRGFVREACSLCTWALAVLLTIRFTPALSDVFHPYIETPTIRTVCAGAILFIMVMVIGGLFAHLITQLVSKTGLTSTDRMLGMVFGLARGILVICVLVLLATLTSIPKEAWWSQSVLIKTFMPMASWLQYFLPEEIAHISAMVSTNSFLASV